MPGTMRVYSHQQAGRLFIKLATETLALPAESDTAGKLQMLKDHGVELNGYDEVRFVRDTDSIKHFVIPARNVIAQALSSIEATKTYIKMEAEQSGMYMLRFAPEHLKSDMPTPEEFFIFRVGDYTTTHCA